MVRQWAPKPQPQHGYKCVRRLQCQQAICVGLQFCLACHMGGRCGTGEASC